MSPEIRQAFDEQASKLNACELHLRRNHQLALAGTLIGSTMHEVNNRLEVIANYLFLARLNSVDPSAGVKFIDDASDELRRVGEITSRSLAFVRNDHVDKDLDLVELANNAIRLHHDRISSKQIDVRMRLQEKAVASANRGELLQVLVNLLLNSIDALPDLGRLYLRVALRSEQAIITIADNGSGIPEPLRPSLFQSFSTSKESGTGLGLWVVKQIIDSHKGTIRYRSNTDPQRNGTTFRITLPLKPPAPAIANPQNAGKES